MNEDHVDALTRACTAKLGEQSHWAFPAGYPNGLALCVLDSVWSIGVRYQGVEAVLRKYRAMRQAAGATPENDGVEELIETISESGGPESFATDMGNRQRTSTRSGILKAAAVELAAVALVHSSISSAMALRTAPPENLAAAEARWRDVPGQRSGISWRYLLLLAGVPGVKPDRMIQRFVAAAVPGLGRHADVDEVAALVIAAASRLQADPTVLDHRMWMYESGRLELGGIRREVTTRGASMAEHLSSSKVQTEAEAAIITSLAAQLDIELVLKPGKLKLDGGTYVEVDAASADWGVVVEAYARQGKLHGAQIKKIAQDILKLALVRREQARQHTRTIIAFASSEARDSITGWIQQAAASFEVELRVVEVPEALRDRIRSAQHRQVMVNLEVVADDIVDPESSATSEPLLDATDDGTGAV